MALLKVLLLLGLGVLVNSDVSLQKRIIGGYNCRDTERLYHVRLVSTNGTHLRRCGGSLIHPQWILTAAHCWKSEPGWTNTAIMKVHPRFAVHLAQEIRQAPVIYKPDGRQHNMMLLKLETPVTDVPLVRLPDCRHGFRLYNVVQLAGEGGTTTGPNNQRLPPYSPIPTHLQCVELNIIQVSVFERVTGFVFHATNPNKDVCYGDAGGAALYNDMIYGVISLGGPRACQYPVAIMDVCKYLGWIKGETGLA